MLTRAIACSFLLALADAKLSNDARSAVLKTDCDGDKHCTWNDAKGEGFCDPGMVPASYEGGHPCITKELSVIQYCAIDRNAYWDISKQECFCEEGYEAWGDTTGGHPCMKSAEFGLAKRKQVCTEDSNATWDDVHSNCFCNAGWEPDPSQGRLQHPCKQSKEL
jgi:hypothetical protein